MRILTLATLTLAVAAAPLFGQATTQQRRAAEQELARQRAAIAEYQSLIDRLRQVGTEVDAQQLDRLQALIERAQEQLSTGLNEDQMRQALEAQHVALQAMAAQHGEEFESARHALEMQAAQGAVVGDQLRRAQETLAASTLGGYAKRDAEAQSNALRAQAEALAWPGRVQEIAPVAAGVWRGSDEFDRSLNQLYGGGPRASWAAQDPADSLWRAARERLNRSDYTQAARLFGRIRTEERFAKSTYRPEAYYYQAFALARLGSRDNLREARAALEQLMEKYPAERRPRDTTGLLTSVRVRLAQMGDASSATDDVRTLVTGPSRVLESGAVAATRSSNIVASAVQSAQMQAEIAQANNTVAQVNAMTSLYGSMGGMGYSGYVRVPPQCAGDDSEIRLIALNALVRMDSSAAMPVLKDVMGRRDECAAQLRDRALMIVARIQTPDAEAMLADAARNDPEPAVRQSALVYLSSRNPDRAVALAEEQLRTASDAKGRDWALQTLARTRTDRGWRAVRDYAGRTDLPIDARRRAIAYLGQSGDSANAAFLRQLYSRAGSETDLRETILMAAGVRRGGMDADWLMTIASNENEEPRLRQYAINMVGRSKTLSFDRLAALYDRTTDKTVKRSVLGAIGERARTEQPAADKLIDIARNEKDLDLKKSAVMYFSQTDDPRKRDLLIEILRR